MRVSKLGKLARTRVVHSPWAQAKPKREALRNEKREAVLRAAASCLATKGVEQTTMDDVAAVLGVTKPTVYRLFRDKTALVQACRERAHERFVNAINEAMAQKGSAVDKLKHYFMSDLHLLHEDEFGRLLIAVTQQDLYSDTSKGARRMRESVEQGIRDILVAGVKNGELRRDLDAKLVALALFATFNFVARWFDPRGPYSLDQIGEQYFALFLDGIRTAR